MAFTDEEMLQHKAQGSRVFPTEGGAIVQCAHCYANLITWGSKTQSAYINFCRLPSHRDTDRILLNCPKCNKRLVICLISPSMANEMRAAITTAMTDTKPNNVEKQRRAKKQIRGFWTRALGASRV